MLTYFCNTYKRNHAPSVQLCEFVRLKSENFATYDFLILTFISLCLIGLFVKYVRDLLPQWDGKIFSAIGGIYTAAMPLLLTIFGALSIYSVFAYLAEFYIGFVGEFISTDAATWGQAGDFFGGMLNPFLGFCSFMALLYTIRIQSEELRLTRQELARTSQANEKLSQANESQLLLSKLQN